MEDHTPRCQKCRKGSTSGKQLAAFFFNSSFKLTSWPFKAVYFLLFGWSFCYPRTFSVPTSLFILYHLFPPKAQLLFLLPCCPHFPCLHVAVLVSQLCRQAGKSKLFSDQMNKLRKQWRGSTSPKPEAYTKREYAPNQIYKSNLWHSCHPSNTAQYPDNILKAIPQYEGTHKNVCTMLPKQQLCKVRSLKSSKYAGTPHFCYELSQEEHLCG